MQINDIISNVKVYGFEESIKASKYPMAVDTSKCTTEITDNTVRLSKGETQTCRCENIFI